MLERASLQEDKQKEYLLNTVSVLLEESSRYMEHKRFGAEFDKSLIEKNLEIINEFCKNENIPTLGKKRAEDFALEVIKDYFSKRKR